MATPSPRRARAPAKPVFNPARYPVLNAAEQRALYRASRIFEKLLLIDQAPALETPLLVRDYLAVRLAGLDREEFHAIWLNARHRVIAAECLSVGTLLQTSVYPREVVKRALAHNAAAVIFAHNHPSGAPEPSPADMKLTDALKQALALIDVTALDHFIIAGAHRLSFAERGLI